MKEDFLHYVWQYKLFKHQGLFTTSNETIEIVKFGMHNKHSGPDFLNAQVKIGEQLWAGNVEIHIKSSDWYAHHHEKDSNYDTVILHVVWEENGVVFDQNNQPIPTLELKNLVDTSLLQNYQQLYFGENDWIPCEKQINSIDDFTLNNWLERLYFERLEDKSILIKQLLEETNNDFETVLFQLIAKNFGLKTNGESFLNLAKSIDFAIVRKERNDKKSFTALLFGQAGFLEEDVDVAYFQNLKKEYNYLVKKHRLHPISKYQFQFFRMRPHNFPTIRIAQLVALFYQQENLFSKIITVKKLDDFYDLFSLKIDEFWETHYTFETVSKKSSKKLTKSFLDLLIINTIIPFQFVFQQHQNKLNQEQILQLVTEIKPEKNSIISKFNALGISAKSAFETQSLLQLKNNYCAAKRCLDCAIGNKILKKK